MKRDKILIASHAVAVSEQKNYLELTNRLCYYGEPNLNGVVLPVERAAEIAQTLVHQPVVARYKYIAGKDDLGGHECQIDPISGEVTFDTMAVGTHISVEVKQDTVNVNGQMKTLPCLFATAHIWKRYKNVVNAVRQLYLSGKLRSSWEIAIGSYTFENGLKYVGDYQFEANCLLGSADIPAYPCAETLSVASMEEATNVLAQAAAVDYEQRRGKDMEEEEKKKQEEQTVNEAPPALDTEKNPEKDTVTQTEEEKKKKADAVCKPTEEKGKAAVTVESYNQMVAEKNEALVKANELIAQLQREVDTLKPYKQAAEQAERQRMEAEMEQKRESLKHRAVSSGRITEEDLVQSDELKQMIAALDEAGINKVIVDRMMSAMDTQKMQASVAPASRIEDSVNHRYDVLTAYLKG